MNRAEFLSRRKNGIGGSDIAAIAGLSPFRSPLDVYFDKTGNGVDQNQTDEKFPIGESAALYWGAVHEANIGRAYTIVTGRKIMRYNRLIQNMETPYFIGDVDFLGFCDDGKTPFVARTGEIRTTKGIECKTGRWANTEEWGEHGSDFVPVTYICQVQWYMGLVPQLESFDIPVLFSGSDFRIYTIHRDDDLIRKLREIGAEFWSENVQKKVPPPPRSYEEVKKLYPVSNGRKMLASVELEQKVKKLSEISEQKSALEAEEADLKSQITSEMGEEEVLALPDDTIIATFKNEKRGRVFRLKKGGKKS